MEQFKSTYEVTKGVILPVLVTYDKSIGISVSYTGEDRMIRGHDTPKGKILLCSTPAAPDKAVQEVLEQFRGNGYITTPDCSSKQDNILDNECPFYEGNHLKRR